MSEDRFAASAREYVESLHQNSRTHLLYGKNNVLVQPVLLQNPPPLPRYLSSHLSKPEQTDGISRCCWVLLKQLIFTAF